MEIKLEIDSNQKILLKRYLNRDGKAQVKFTQECAKAFNKYVSYDSGRLKDMNVVLKATSINYNSDYAAKQHNENRGAGKQGTSMRELIGSFWDKRSWSENGYNVVKIIADFVGWCVKK